MWDQIQGKRILFVTTKNLDYLRNTQEIRLLQRENAAVTVIGSCARSYLKRILYVWGKLLLVKASSFDLVFWGFSPQLTLPFFRWKFKKLIQMEDFFISLYDTCCCDRDYFSPNSFFGKLLHFLDRRTLLAASTVITDTKSHGAFFAHEFHIDPQKFKTLYLEADSSIYDPNIPRTGTDRSTYNVLYFGNMLPLQGVEVIVEACEILRSADQLSFTIIGPLSKNLHSRLKKLNNVVQIPYLPQPELAKTIAQADLCLAGHFHPTIGKAARTIPGKAYIYRQMNKPMILGDTPANHELFAEGEPGIYFVPRGNPQKLADRILSISGKNS